MKMAEVRMTMEEYLQLLNGLTSDMGSSSPPPADMPEPKPKKKKMSAYMRRYKANFAKIENEYKLKNGNWKKNGFKRAVKEAHRMSKM